MMYIMLISNLLHKKDRLGFLWGLGRGYKNWHTVATNIPLKGFCLTLQKVCGMHWCSYLTVLCHKTETRKLITSFMPPMPNSHFCYSKGGQ